MRTRKPIVLIVEDEASFRLLYADALKQVGVTVKEAEDGDQAWKLLQKEKFDLVLLDLILPKLDGLSLLQMMKADTATRDIPVIVSSVLGEDREVQQALKLGAQKFLRKGTVSTPEIAQIVKQLATNGNT